MVILHDRIAMNLLTDIRTARARYPWHAPGWELDFLYEPLPVPADHPELPLFPEEGGGSGVRVGFEPRGRVPFPATRLEEPMPARMLNEFVYCPRLFYYEYVDGVFLESADTERGSAIHEKVDRGKGALPMARKVGRKGRKGRDKDKGESAELDLPDGEAGSAARECERGAVAGEEGNGDADGGGTDAETETIHSRSAMLSSERLGVVAKMDLIEVVMGRVDGGDAGDAEMDAGAALSASVAVPLWVTPVDYKAGSPRVGAEANELWDTDKMQLGLQILILRDNGYRCEEGVIFYRGSRQRVRLTMTGELEGWILKKIEEARDTALGSMPPPLVGSPKCVRCSLAPVCLPDETRLLARGGVRGAPEAAPLGIAGDEADDGPGGERVMLRRLMAARDEERALYLNTPGVRVGRKDEVLVVKDGEATLDEVRARDVTHVALFGNIQLSTQALHMLCELEVPVAYFSMGGWFYGLTRGHGLKNVFTRIEQFRAAEDGRRCLALASRFVNGKIRNQRTLLMRLHVETPAGVLLRLKLAAVDALAAGSMESLLGIEGAAAALYFQHFHGMIKVEREEDALPGLEPDGCAPGPGVPEFAFDFTRRTRRPPTDPVNALLSLGYSLLAKDCTIAAHAVGFDPYVGFYHQPRFGRPALALDLMEEFRPLVAESAVLTALNNRMMTPGHFVRAGEAVNLTPAGRKVFFQAYEQRMNTLITHPIFDYKVSYRRVLELQARLLARHLTGEIPDYVPMVTR